MANNSLTFNAIHVRASPPTYRNSSPSCEGILVGDEADQVLQVSLGRVCIDPQLKNVIASSHTRDCFFWFAAHFWQPQSSYFYTESRTVVFSKVHV